MNGVICCGKMTISRTGIIGTRLISCFSRVNMRAPELLPLPLGSIRPKIGRTLNLMREPAHPAFSSKLQLISRVRTISALDRKSTRLNSSHLVISYAVFCLNKKKMYNTPLSVVGYEEDL